MLKKILLGSAIAVVFSTASYAQNQPPQYYQAWFNDAQNAYNQAKNEPCFNSKVSAALNQLQNDQSSMTDWINLANNTLLPPVGQSDIRPSPAGLNALAAELPVANNENNQVMQLIWALGRKPVCVEQDKPAIRTPGAVSLTPEDADATLRVLLGLPTGDAERTARELDKTLKDDPKAGKDQLNGDGKQSEQTAKTQDETPKQSNSKSTQDQPQAPAKTDTKTDTKADFKTATEPKIETKTETNPEHSTRTVTPEKVDAPKQVARAAPVEHTTELRNVEAHQTISHVNVASAHVNSIGNLGVMHTNGMSAMHMGGMGGLGGMHMGGLGGMHMGGLGGMHFGRM